MMKNLEYWQRLLDNEDAVQRNILESYIEFTNRIDAILTGQKSVPDSIELELMAIDLRILEARLSASEKRLSIIRGELVKFDKHDDVT